VLGHRGVDLAGRPVECLAADADASQPSSPWQAMARGIELVDADITVASRDGNPVPMSVSSSLLQAQDGGARCGFAVWRDVSRRRQSELGLVDSQQRLKTLAYELTLAESRERARIAQGLHDDIGQLLTLAHFKLDEWASTQAASMPGNVALIDDLAALLRQATQATRSATFDLFCPLLRPLGLQTAIEGMAQRLAHASRRMSVRLEGSVPALPLPEPVQAVVFRVVRELSLNAQKHAQATTLTIRLDCADGTLRIGVVDDGRGFEPRAATREFSPDGGFGLSSAEAQMRAIGGHLEIETGAGKGTRATLVLPLRACIGPEPTAS
jgi:signal transduction histidine kinase